MALENRSILFVIEEEEELRESLVSALSGRGRMVIGLRSIHETVQHPLLNQTKAIVTESRFVDSTIYDLMLGLSKKNHRCPVIVLSSQVGQARPFNFPNMDTLQFFEKPCELAKLENAVEKALHKGSSSRSSQEDISSAS